MFFGQFVSKGDNITGRFEGDNITCAVLFASDMSKGDDVSCAEVSASEQVTEPLS